MKETLLTFTEDILGIRPETNLNGENLLNILLQDYAQAKIAKDYQRVDYIRSRLKEEGITIKDMKDAVGWAYSEQ